MEEIESKVTNHTTMLFNIDKFIKLTSIVDAREKILRLTQFFIVLLLAWYPQKPILSQLKLQILILRKFLRCFKPIEHSRNAIRLFKNKKTGDNSTLLILKNICFVFYLGLDQIVLLRMLNVIPNNNLTNVQLPKFTNLFWLTALTIDTRWNLKEIATIQRSRKLMSTKRNDIDKEKRMIQLESLNKKQTNAIRKIIWDILDSFIVSTYLHYINSFNYIVGLSGITTSLMAIKDILEKC